MGLSWRSSRASSLAHAADGRFELEAVQQDRFEGRSLMIGRGTR
jgi:hypothetical protein